MSMSVILTSIVAPVVIALATGGFFVSLLQRKKTKADTADQLVKIAMGQVTHIQTEIDRARARAEEAEDAQEVAEAQALVLLQQLRRIRIAAIAAGVDLPPDSQKGP